MNIQALDIQSGKIVSITPDATWIIPGDFRAIASIPNSQLCAELDLTHPEQGWKIYPN